MLRSICLVALAAVACGARARPQTGPGADWRAAAAVASSGPGPRPAAAREDLILTRGFTKTSCGGDDFPITVALTDVCAPLGTAFSAVWGANDTDITTIVYPRPRRNLLRPSPLHGPSMSRRRRDPPPRRRLRGISTSLSRRRRDPPPRKTCTEFLTGITRRRRVPETSTRPRRSPTASARRAS